ncbi:glycerol-3-phosphate dehydrogenase [Marinobacter zhejiangensis]|uniref:Glycerol-3-phosphate dehydrogenase n=1 Tax=Marinobacter zhejiangensis TaxID=488535 RepID=A0A1I4N7V9_9GAMM|nr:glycerol-3-phosphate dehydrogenase [Marinobacter zhejiangensis]SFM11579.1 glycerol-3-phosphate dehydrogenase [Marinobacter zhejiangensis]
MTLQGNRPTASYATSDTYDLLVVGGGINGCGIAADAAGRGLRVMLCEKGDLGSATSSASSKLVHGGLRYLEHYEFRLVREALAEREVLLKVAPHLVRPMRFTLPHQPHLRPGWMIRCGLFLYDHLAPRETLPGAKSRRFDGSGPLNPRIKKGYSYSDCWVDDARLVIANAQAARNHGARIERDTLCVRARRLPDQSLWAVETESTQTGLRKTVYAKALVNASGPWAARLFDDAFELPSPHNVRLVKGSHIVVPRIVDQEGAYILQNTDRRIVFVLPYEDNFNLIGTTDKEYQGNPNDAHIDDDEIQYLLDVVNGHFIHQIDRKDIVHTYSGVRPLLDDESSDPSAITRDYTLELQGSEQEAPLLSIFGGKITTYRKLAEAAVEKLRDHFPQMPPSRTRQQALPGATEEINTRSAIRECLATLYPKLPAPLIDRYSRCYGILAIRFLGSSETTRDLGEHFGDTLYQKEVAYLMSDEWARTTDDILWRRTKLGLRLEADQVEHLKLWMAGQSENAA